MGTRQFLLAALYCWVTLSLALAEEPVAAPLAAGSPAPVQAIGDLDAAEFSQRQEASRKLLEAGGAVFPELEKAAEHGSREASVRALEIFEQHFERGDQETKHAARVVLERLAKSDKAGVAQRANSVLNPPPEAQGLPVGRFGAIPAIQRANIQIRVAANNGNGNVRRVHVRNENGKRTIEVEENGKKTKVQDGDNGGIEVEITKRINDKDATEKFQAKDLDDLRKKDAEAARIYEQAGQNGNRIQIQAGRIQFGQPGQAGQPPKEVVERLVKSLDDHIKRLEGKVAGNPAIQAQIDLLKQRKQQYERLIPAAQPAEAPAPADQP